MSDLEQRVKELETKVKILEETLETLKNMQLSKEMEGYIQSKTKSLKIVSLMNTVSEQPVLDFSKEEKSIQSIRETKNSIDQQIAGALRDTTDFSEQYPDDPRYFNYEVESGIVSNWFGIKEKNTNLSQYIGKGIRITSYNGFDSERVIVPKQINGQPVTSIGEQAFENAKFSELILPSSLIAILGSAFYGCINLKHIDLPKNLEYLGSNCFSRTGLESIHIPNFIEIIPEYCFENCKNMQNIILGNRTRELHLGAFESCQKLNQISLSETVKVIERNCFDDTAIKTLIVPSGVCKISGEVFGSLRTSDTITCVFLGRQTEILGTEFKKVNQIYCLPGSNVQKYARIHSISMKPLSEFNLDETEIG